MAKTLLVLPPPPSPLHAHTREERSRRNSPNTISEWRTESKAAKAAGQVSSGILVAFLQCHVCSICIGRGYVETELYLWPRPPGTKLCLVDDYIELTEFTILHLCGGCARRRQLPETLLTIAPEHYQTRVLLDEDGLGVSRPLGIHNEEDNLALRLAISRHIEVAKARMRIQHLLAFPRRAKGGKILPFQHRQAS